MAKSRIQKRSRLQEARAAEDVGGRAQVGSGSAWNAKGDVRVPLSLRLECKFTGDDVYILHIDDLKKIREEALKGGLEDWAFQIEFTKWKRKYAVVDYKYFRYLHGFSSVDGSLCESTYSTKGKSIRVKTLEVETLSAHAKQNGSAFCVSLRFDKGTDTFGRHQGVDIYALVDWDEFLTLREAYRGPGDHQA
jgi:hypothetical protein